MNKEKYIIELRKRLSILDSNEIDNIVVEYLDFIKQKQNEGATEEVALEQLGNVNDIAKKILQSYKISESYIKLFIGKEKVIDEINEIVVKFADISSTVYNKLEESVTEFARTTGHLAKNVFNETKKFSEEKFNEVKSKMKKANSDSEEEIDPNQTDFEVVE